MASARTRLRRQFKAAHRKSRELLMVAKGLLSRDHPVQAQLIPMRRCNLSCTYCSEFDDISDPVPLEELYRRIDKLAELGTTVVVISGGEPLLHPELDDVIRRIRSHGIICGLITNGYLLVPERIQRLNRAGLDHLQISIDNVQPDDVSVKSLKVLDRKLQWLKEHADFHVNINSVIGAGVKNQWDALTVAKRALELGFSSTVGIIHDSAGQLKPLAEDAQAVFQQTSKLTKRSYARLNGFQNNIAQGKPNNWRCRAGARFLYICEHGLVHYCSQQRGFPGIPIAEYTKDDIRREFLTQKACAPVCTVSCVHQTSLMDFWRAPQTGESHATVGGAQCECTSRNQDDLVQIGPGTSVSSVEALTK